MGGFGKLCLARSSFVGPSIASPSVSATAAVNALQQHDVAIQARVPCLPAWRTAALKHSMIKMYQ